MRILIADAHTLSGKGTGASSLIDESRESRTLSKLVASTLKSFGHHVNHISCDSSPNYLKYLTDIANKENYDLCIQIHFNAFQKTNNKMGTEVFYYHTNEKTKKIASETFKELSKYFKPRGVKTNKQMNGRDAWLRLNKNPAILIETCFVDSVADVEMYKKHTTDVANAICTPFKPKNINPNKLYRVIVGAYNKENANKVQQELKSKGYKDTYQMEVK